MNIATEGNIRRGDLRLLDACLIADRLCAEPCAPADGLERRLAGRNTKVQSAARLQSAARRRREAVHGLAAA